MRYALSSTFLDCFDNNSELLVSNFVSSSSDKFIHRRLCFLEICSL